MNDELQIKYYPSPNGKNIAKKAQGLKNSPLADGGNSRSKKLIKHSKVL